MKLIYLSTITIPGQLANRVQTIKMSEAFSRVCDFKLYVGKKLSPDKEIFNNYGVRNSFEIIELGIPKLKPRSFFSLLRYLKIIKKEKPDFVYIREHRLAFLLSFFYSDLILETHSSKGYFIRSLLKKVKKNIVITKYLSKVFQSQGISKDKILVSPDSVDIERFSVKCSKIKARKKLNLPQNKTIVVYTGNLYKWKGVQTLIDSLKYFDEECLLILVGGTEKDVKELIMKNKKIKNVLIIGHRLHAKIPYWLKSADILVLPNSGQQEISKNWTSPLKLFEYMASKRPIVASDLPSTREILNEENAVLVEPDNPKKIAQGIQMILKDNNLAEKISSKAFQDVKQYTWQNRAQNILEFISIK